MFVRKLDRTGHTEVECDVETGVNVDLAKRLFQEAIDNGHMAVAVAPDGTKEAVHAFDPKAAEIILMPRLVGG